MFSFRYYRVIKKFYLVNWVIFKKLFAFLIAISNCDKTIHISIEKLKIENLPPTIHQE